MYISELIIENYKGFADKHICNFRDTLTFFVGNNNTGKSSIFEAIDFLKNGIPKGKTLSDIKTKGSGGHLSVTLKLQNNITGAITDFSEKKYLTYVFDEGGNETLIAKRTSEELEITQNNKKVQINAKKITLWNPKTEQFENPAGIDRVFGSLFESQFVWADTNPDDVADFGTTKICGRLLTGAIGDFFDTTLWSNFKEVHDKTFHSDKNSLTSRTKSLEGEINAVIKDQYGPADVTFNFQLPDATSFLKSGDINIDDGTDTSSKNKGTGLQRALAFALIQIYATNLTKHPEDPKKTKPLFLFIDEPETFMHPKAQFKFLDAINIISKTRQVFITTHSPFLLKFFDKSIHDLFIFSRTSDKNSVEPSSALSLFGISSPTWGEINYFAYDVISVEFHNELYGFVQAKAIQDNDNNYLEDNFEQYLVSNCTGLEQSKEYTKLKKNGSTEKQQRTIPTYIRNMIHHPENSHNKKYTENELKESIEKLIGLL